MAALHRFNERRCTRHSVRLTLGSDCTEVTRRAIWCSGRVIKALHRLDLQLASSDKGNFGVWRTGSPQMSGASRADMFVDSANDPREGGPTLGDERTTLVEFLRCQRLTLEVKCAGLDADEMARRSVEPSTMSLLGLVRHMAEVERNWFRRVMSGQDAPPHFYSDTNRDGDFDGAVADPDVIVEAWRIWRAEMTFADQVIADAPDLAITNSGKPWISLREVLVHMVEEYARHNGHADLLRERIDGRLGE